MEESKIREFITQHYKCVGSGWDKEECESRPAFAEIEYTKDRTTKDEEMLSHCQVCFESEIEGTKIKFHSLMCHHCSCSIRLTIKGKETFKNEEGHFLGVLESQEIIYQIAFCPTHGGIITVSEAPIKEMEKMLEVDYFTPMKGMSSCTQYKGGSK